MEEDLVGQGRSLSPCSANRNYLLAQIVHVAFVRRKIKYKRLSPLISGKCYNEVRRESLAWKVLALQNKEMMAPSARIIARGCQFQTDYYCGNE